MKLNPAELDAGLALLKRGGLCELLPPFFEVDALEQSWLLVRPILAGIDLRAYTPQPAITLVAAKQRYVVRPIQVLDPLDCLLYSALVARLAPGIERNRQPVEARRVFSYRWSDDPDANLVNPYRAFRERAVELCDSYPYVAKADIADFFPSIYLHRLRNALDAATRLNAETALLERWLMRWSPDTTPTSIGLPVGQLASNILAEALLIEVDDYLSRDYVFVRYVDDYLIFCQSRSEALAALHDLGQRLLLAERLNLSISKTTTEPSTKVKREFSGARSSLSELQDEFVERALGGDPYGHIDLDQVDAELMQFIQQIDARRMLEEALRSETPNTQKLGFALQVMGATGDASAAPALIEQLPVLAAASRHIGLYFAALGSVWSPELEKVAAGLVKYIRESRFVTPYQLIWLLEPFIRNREWNHYVDVLRIMKSSTNVLVRRQAMLAASQSRRRDALVDVRLALSEVPWLRRAALFGARFLPTDERKHVWGDFGDRDWSLQNCLERSVIRHAKVVDEEEAGSFDPNEIPF